MNSKWKIVLSLILLAVAGILFARWVSPKVPPEAEMVELDSKESRKAKEFSIELWKLSRAGKARDFGKLCMQPIPSEMEEDYQTIGTLDLESAKFLSAEANKKDQDIRNV